MNCWKENHVNVQNVNSFQEKSSQNNFRQLNLNDFIIFSFVKPIQSGVKVTKIYSQCIFEKIREIVSILFTKYFSFHRKKNP